MDLNDCTKLKFKLVTYSDKLVYMRIETIMNLPHLVKTQYLHFKLVAKYFLLHWNIPGGVRPNNVIYL